jgi:integrase
MATGIVKRHSGGCGSREGGRCNCGAGYEAWVNVRRNGKPVKVRKTFARESEAKSWRADALAAANRGALRPAKRDTRTLAEGVEDFVEKMKSGEVRPKRRAAYKPATIRTYDQHVRLYLADSHLGQTRVTEVSKPDVQEFADGLLAELAPGTVANVLNPIQAFYRQEVARGRLGINPAQGIDVPDADSEPVRIASAAEAEKLLAALPEGDRPMWACAFYAGLRRGELQALRCSDVDLGASLIHVRRGWDQYEGEITPKSPKSRRSVPLLAVLRDYLDEHLLRTGRSGEDLVFGTTSSDQFCPAVTDKRAKRAWEAAELEPITLHECRHTFASLMIDAGANPKAIQEAMGHSKIQTTFDTYGHLIDGSRDEVRKRMDAYLAGAVSSSAATPAIHPASRP